MKDFEKKFERAFEDARKHRDGLDAAVQAWKDRISQLSLSGVPLDDFRVFHKTENSIGIRHDPRR